MMRSTGAIPLITSRFSTHTHTHGDLSRLLYDFLFHLETIGVGAYSTYQVTNELDSGSDSVFLWTTKIPEILTDVCRGVNSENYLVKSGSLHDVKRNK